MGGPHGRADDAKRCGDLRRKGRLGMIGPMSNVYSDLGYPDADKMLVKAKLNTAS